ncbi:hypothetical protein PGT21_024559 [Puccinia graminis f. sp. tritici]|uniref:Uncharacterized protein n=1 Tax=Puccinia graminis f. sp. tritici TaxID=56615 RepID=A0A5B0PW77_PUCGR|nr:hypothetical protein PGT21_024559 [Puccinia graminis f. sp. tritici]
MTQKSKLQSSSANEACLTRHRPKDLAKRACSRSLEPSRTARLHGVLGEEIAKLACSRAELKTSQSEPFRDVLSQELAKPAFSRGLKSRPHEASPQDFAKPVCSRCLEFVGEASLFPMVFKTWRAGPSRRCCTHVASPRLAA